MEFNKIEIDLKIMEYHYKGLISYDNWYLIAKGDSCSFNALVSDENEIIYILENDGEVSDSSDFEYVLNEFKKLNNKK